MNVRLTQGILGFGVLAFALWLYPGPAGAQQPENTVVCVEMPEAIPLNYGDNTSGCAIDPAIDLDHFSFAGVAGTSIRFNVLGTSVNFDPRLEIRDPTGAPVPGGDEFCNGGSVSVCSFSVDLDLLLTGTYRIAISDSGTNETGGYQFSLNCLVGSCPAAPALPAIAYDVPTIDEITPEVDMDFFTFEGAGGSSIRFNVLGTSTFFDPRLEIWDPTGAPVEGGECPGGSVRGCSFQVDLGPLLTGTYRIAISDSGTNDTGSYQLSLNCLVGSCPAAPALPAIAYDVAVVDAIDPAADMDFFTFEGAGGTAIRFNVLGTSVNFDPRLEIWDPTGAPVPGGDEFCNGGSVSVCSFSVDLGPLLPGTYRIAISDSGTDETGGYQFSLNCLVGSCPAAPALPAIAYDVPVVDEIDPEVDMDFFTFEGAAGTSIRFNVLGTSTFFDPLLEIWDPTGMPLEGGECPGGSVSGCSFSVDLGPVLTGTYRIAISDSGTNDTGSYQLSLNCLFGSCLVITPGTDFLVEGFVGGPFETIETYTLTNNGFTTVDFTASASENFVTLSQTSGTLPGGASTTVEVSINANANNLGPAVHAAKVDFKNVTNGQGDTDRLVQLTVKCPGTLEVTPGTAYRPLGPAGGPFAPDAKTYTLRNPLMDFGGTLCTSEFEFSVEAIGNFISLSPTSGTLKPDDKITVTVSLNDNANGLADGSYDGTVMFTNTTFNLGDTARGVTLIVEPTMVEPTPWTIVPLLDLLLGPDESQGPDSP